MRALLLTAGVVWASSTQAQSIDRQANNVSCELHIFPTTELIDASPDYLKEASPSGPSVIGALIGGALSSAQSSGSGKLRATALKQMQDYLAPEKQIQAIEQSDIRVLLKLPVDTKIVEEDSLPVIYNEPKDPDQKIKYKYIWSKMSKGRSLSATSNTCYRELIVSSISIAKGLGGFVFKSGFIYRAFDKDLAEIKLFDGENSVPRPIAFPAQSDSTIPEASSSLRAAFVENFSRWVSRRVKL